MRYWVLGLLMSVLLAFAFACSDGPTDEEGQDDSGDFSAVDEAACACEETCLSAEFDCAATCTDFNVNCIDDCRAAYADCALVCGGCISVFNDCCAGTGGDDGQLASCEKRLIQCQEQACGWDSPCLDQCNAAADDCAETCGDDWDCYAVCLDETKICYSDCF